MELVSLKEAMVDAIHHKEDMVDVIHKEVMVDAIHHKEDMVDAILKEATAKDLVTVDIALSSAIPNVATTIVNPAVRTTPTFVKALTCISGTKMSSALRTMTF